MTRHEVWSQAALAPGPPGTPRAQPSPAGSAQAPDSRETTKRRAWAGLGLSKAGEKGWLEEGREWL